MIKFSGIIVISIFYFLLSINPVMAQSPKGQGQSVMGGWLENHANDIDTDKDKIITIDDLIALGKEAVESLDKDHDGRLSPEELLDGKTTDEKRAYGIPLSLQAGWVLVHSKDLDFDGDGFITRIELISAAVATVKTYDKNSDAKLTGDELIKLATGEGADAPPDTAEK